nr:MAG TPA: hypothetical protein [Caudoviricetes sp.]DAT38893.1 MAG TPA: hypothetical protein [Caudoviricetes sp.]DAX28058.1 MAG TPA: hypothetical protein [Caudoviricetes sp.]
MYFCSAILRICDTFGAIISHNDCPLVFLKDTL